MDPENVDAYIGLLMAEFRVKKFEELQKCQVPLDCSNNYQRVIKFGTDETKEKLEAYNKSILANIKENKRNQIYMKAVQQMNNAESAEGYAKAIALFKPIRDYRDVKQLMEQCEAKRKVLKEKEKKTNSIEVVVLILAVVLFFVVAILCSI